MPLGVSLTQLLADLRSEIGVSPKVNVGVDARDAHIELLNRVQRTLYDEHKWPHLNVVEGVTLQAGQRYYDPPSTVDFDRLDRAALYGWSNEPFPVERGIGFDHYAVRDSDADEREDPVQAWDIRWTGSASQIEVWPIPISNGKTLKFFGTRKLTALVNGSDTCGIDSVAIVLFAAAELLARQKAGDAENKLALANRRLRTIKNNAAGPERMTGYGIRPRALPRGVQVIPSIRS